MSRFPEHRRGLGRRRHSGWLEPWDFEVVSTKTAVEKGLQGAETKLCL